MPTTRHEYPYDISQIEPVAEQVSEATEQPEYRFVYGSDGGFEGIALEERRRRAPLHTPETTVYI